MQIQKCTLCEQPIKETHYDERMFYNYDCERCGGVRITDDAAYHLAQHPEIEKYKLSGVCRDRFELRKPPLELLRANINTVIAGTPESISQKLYKILDHIKINTKHLGERITFEWDKDYPIAYAANVTEFDYLIKHLEDRNFIEVDKDNKVFDARLTIQGWDYIDSIKKVSTDTDQVFVAMWFDERLNKAYEDGFSKAIKECDYNPIRIDLIHHNDKIDDRIILEIKRSAFLIADFTGHRGGVYFEAGFAMGLNIPVIWTCKEDEIDKTHFDTRQYNHIVWKDTDDLYQQLCDRIRATIK